MYCSACGQALVPGQPVCGRCGRPSAVMPPVPGFEFELQSYAGRIRALSIVWFIYAALGLVFGLFGLLFADAMLAGHMGPWMRGPWMHGPMPPFWFGPAIHLAWIFVLLRTGLAFAAGWGLLHRAPWGRVVAIIAAIFGLLKFPFGTALGIWTLVLLVGYRNTRLYEELPPA